jgi:hypothetical protein
MCNILVLYVYQYVRCEPPESLSKAKEVIQVKKDELYDLIAKSETTDRQNKQLLKTLSTQINPRPLDSQWLVHSQTYAVLCCVFT